MNENEKHSLNSVESIVMSFSFDWYFCIYQFSIYSITAPPFIVFTLFCGRLFFFFNYIMEIHWDGTQTESHHTHNYLFNSIILFYTWIDFLVVVADDGVCYKLQIDMNIENDFPFLHLRF